MKKALEFIGYIVCALVSLAIIVLGVLSLALNWCIELKFIFIMLSFFDVLFIYLFVYTGLEVTFEE